MTRLLSLLAFATLALTARDVRAQSGTSRSAQADTVIQAGTYDLSIVYGGGLLQATLEIGYVRDSMTAVLKLGDHDSPVKAGTRRGNKLTLEPNSPAMNVRYELEFNGANVKGTFTFQGDAGTLTGKRRATR